MKTTYSISINQTDDQGQQVGNLSMTTTDQSDLLRLMKNAGIGAEAEETWSDDPADHGMCPVCNAKPCGCNEEVEEDYANEPKPAVVSTSGGNEFGEQRPQQDQRRVTARQGDNPIKKEDVDALAAKLEEQYLKEWSEVSVNEKAKSPYAIGMAQAMKSTGDKPPLEKSTITKAHKIAKSVMAKEEQVEEEPNEGNEFSGALAKAKAAGAKEFEVDGKKYQVKEGKKPDFLDLDKDGDKTEPMDKAAKEKEDDKLDEGFKGPEQEAKVRARLKQLEDTDPDNMYKIVADEFDMSEEELRDALHDEKGKDTVGESSAELDYLKALINWSPKHTQVKEVTEDMINQGTVDTGDSELNWLKAVVKYQPR